MEKKKQTMRYSDAELSLIKNTFAENEDLLKALRKVFLQIPLDELDKSAIIGNIHGKTEVLKVLRKCYLPTIEADAPVQQIIDLWMTIDIKDKTPEGAWPFIIARENLINYLEQQLLFLETLDDTGEIRFSEMVGTRGKDEDSAFIALVTRNLIIGHSEQQIQQLNILAGQKSESVEDTLERLKKDSSR